MKPSAGLEPATPSLPRIALSFRARVKPGPYRPADALLAFLEGL